jgi:hypothetical protein
MRTIALTIALLTATAGAASAELDLVWEHTYGGSAADGFRAAIPTSDGGFVAVGYTYSAGAGDVDLFVVKTNASGDTLWTKTFGGPSLDYGHGVCETADGAVVVAGYTMSFGAGGEDVYLLKLDADGSTLWSRTYGGTGLDEARSVCLAGDGCIIVAGQTESFGAGLADVYLLKVDAAGDTLWTRTFGGAGSEWADAVCETADGCYGLSGTTGSFYTTRDAYLLKVSAAGALVWENRYGSITNYREDYGAGICAHADGGIVASGWRTDQDHGDPCQLAYLRVDSGGGQTTYQKYADPYLEYGKSITGTADGGYLICGAAKDVSTHRNDLLLVRRTPGTGWDWQQIVGGAGSDKGCSVVQIAPGEYLIAGYTESSGSGSFDGWLLRMRETAVSVPTPTETQTGIHFESPIPNPFSPRTMIRFRLPEAMDIELAVYDVTGRRVAVLTEGTREPGAHAVSWQGTDDEGNALGPGVYWARLAAEGQAATQKIVRLR